MAQIKAFPGYRYDPRRFPDVSDVTAPPYDVIGAAQQQALYDRHEANIVRVILGREEAGDSDDHNRHTRARDTIRAWIDAGTLRAESDDALYVYDQTFTIDGAAHTRRGLFAAVKLEPFGEGGIHPHEDTLPGPKADRLSLMRAVAFNTSPIFAMYPDGNGAARQAIGEAARGEPDQRCVDPDGVTHELRAVTDGAAIAAIADRFHEKDLFVADGHHRYETAVTYRDACGATGDGTHGADHAMLVLVAAEDPGLLAFPTHRVVHGIEDFSADALLADLGAHFSVREASREDVRAIAGEEGAGRARFGLTLAGGGGAGRHFLLELTDATAMDARAPDRKAGWRALDVSVLHLLILEDLLGIDAAALARHENIRYVRDARKAVAQAADGADGAQAGFVMRPTSVRQVMDVSADGERLPQKTTYFHPKLLSGLVLRKIL